VGGGDVERRIADEQRGGGRGAEVSEGVRGELGLGLEPRRVLGAEVGVEERGEAEVIADESGGGAEFVGENGGLGAGGADGGEDFAGAGEQDDVVEHGGVPVRAVDRERFGDAVGADERGDGVFEAAADGGANAFIRGRREAEFHHRVAVAAMDRGEVVDECAVEVEKDRGERRHERVTAP
jgi:hypothetical protein